MLKLTEEDKARDLAADMAAIDHHRQRWMIPLLWEGRVTMAWPDWHAFSIRLPLVAEAAIRRASYAEARSDGAEAILERLVQAHDEGRGDVYSIVDAARKHLVEGGQGEDSLP